VRVDGTGHPGSNLPSQQIGSITLAPFTDDEDSVHQFTIGAVAAAGITQGCTSTTFCPKSAVGRGQMAAFLARALRLPRLLGPRPLLRHRRLAAAGRDQRPGRRRAASAGSPTAATGPGPR
jgi:hypothetical protein